MFTDIFVKILQERNLTPYKVAKGTGISQGLMSEYAKGKKVPSIKNLTRIASFLEVPIDTFACESTDTAMENVTVSPLDTLTPKERKAVDDLIADREAISNYAELTDAERQMINDIVATVAKHKRKL